MNTADLLGLILRLRLERDAELQAKFDRSLPFADGQFDRWERARRLGFAEGASIYDSSCVFGRVTVGESTWIGPWTMLDGSGGGISIGRFCSVSAGVHIYTHDTVGWALSGGRLTRREGSVSIGDNVYLGSQSVVALGSCVGTMSVVASNSFVSGTFPPRSVIGGTPARVIGRVEGNGSDIELVYPDHRSAVTGQELPPP
jgi:acetyltransferase-like isoleucine patch superfamily enzyme